MTLPWSHVGMVLLGSCWPQVFTAIVKSVTINVISLSVTCDQLMHEDRGLIAIRLAYASLCIRPTIFTTPLLLKYAPAKLADKIKIFIINDSLAAGSDPTAKQYIPQRGSQWK